MSDQVQCELLRGQVAYERRLVREWRLAATLVAVVGLAASAGLAIMGAGSEARYQAQRVAPYVLSCWRCDATVATFQTGRFELEGYALRNDAEPPGTPSWQSVSPVTSAGMTVSASVTIALSPRRPAKGRVLCWTCAGKD
jgi:hypothetical protein